MPENPEARLTFASASSLRAAGRRGSPSRWAIAGRLFVAVVFSVAVWSIDWAGLRGAPFEDLENYITNFSSGAYYVGEDLENLIQWYANEYLWRLSVYALAEHFTVPDIFTGLTLAALLAMVSYVALRASSPLYLLLLLNPAFIDLCFSQTRSAVAVGLVYLAFILARGLPAAALVVIAASVHSAAPIVGGVYFLNRVILKYRWAAKRRVWLALGYLAAVVLGLTVLRTMILGAIDDRRLVVETALTGVALTAMIGAYSLPFLYRAQFLKGVNPYLAVLGPVLAVAMYLTGQNGVRFVAFALPAIAVAVSHLPERWWRAGAFCAFVASQAVYFIYWLQ